ncbi:uncharacterized protein LOC131531399 isoform X1 [Onychostoma macrolepis]|uniref:uncharacterized protein LOC131531399 isoform X1 n=1 Tax=Onychostoma macrolepis TaxID=369639 RepID=UPI00272C0A5B|nr:uncharacterized protein LOC131531399 isoform X1 [Onychostoma macrolepis]
MEGDPVTLYTNVTKRHHDIMLWYCNDTCIVLINRGPSTSCVYDGESGRFRDRLKVDYETGFLIITDIRAEHAGRYEAELIRSNSSGTSQSFNRPRKCDGTKIYEKNSDSEDIIKRFSLTVSASDSGKNKDEAQPEPDPQHKETSSGLSPAAVAGIVVGVVVVVLLVAAAVVVGRRRKTTEIVRNVNEIETSERQVSMDEIQNERSLMI